MFTPNVQQVSWQGKNKRVVVNFISDDDPGFVITDQFFTSDGDLDGLKRSIQSTLNNLNTLEAFDIPPGKIDLTITPPPPSDPQP